MLDGLWTANFASNIDAFGEGSPAEGSGIFVFNNNVILGGDVFYYYTGTYEYLVDNKFKGKLHVTRYIEKKSMFGQAGSVFGDLSEFDLEFIAEVNDNVILGTGSLVQYENATFAARAIKRADLPG